MTRTDIHYEKQLTGDNSINIQGSIMIPVHCPSPHCHLSINQVSFNVQTDGQSGDYMPFGKHNKYLVLFIYSWVSWKPSGVNSEPWM